MRPRKPQWRNWKRYSMDNQKKLLRTYRSQYSLTWPAVAESLGVALSTVEAWHAERNPLPYTARVIIKVFMAEPPLFEMLRGQKKS